MSGSTLAGAQVIDWIGVDVGKQTFDACVYPREIAQEITASVMRKWQVVSLPRTLAGAEQLLAYYREQYGCEACPRIVMESTGSYSRQLAEWLEQLEPGLHVAIVNPRRVRDYAGSLGMRNKTDKIDARVIASFGCERRPGKWQPMAPCYSTLQQLHRVRQQMVETRTAQENQIQELGRSNLSAKSRGSILASLEAIVSTLKEQIEKLEGEIAALIEANPQLRSDVAVADSVPGIGIVVASGLLGEIGDLRRFKSRKQLETFAGMNVGVRSSGTSLNTCTGLSKQGSARIRRLLFLAAMANVRTDNAISRHYRQLVKRGKPKKKALGSVMRKILTVVRRLIVNGSLYDDALANPA